MKTILTNLDNNIFTITLNRPETLNTLNYQMLVELNQAIDEAQSNSEIKIVVLEGAGKHFMAGADITHFKKIIDDPMIDRTKPITESLNVAQDITKKISQLTKPVIAKIRGVAVGYGLSLVLVCDFAIASDDSLFSTAYSAIGLSPDGGMSQTLVQRVGAKKALELFMFNERFNAQKSLELGIINYISNADNLEQDTLNIANKLLNAPKEVFAQVKNLISSAQHNTFSAHLEQEKGSFLHCSQHEDFAIRVNKFLSKQK